MENFKLLAFLLLGFRDMTSQSYPSPEGNESSQFDVCNLELTRIRKKITFTPENIFSGPKLYSPTAFPWFSSKAKNQFLRRPIYKTTAAIPW